MMICQNIRYSTINVVAVFVVLFLQRVFSANFRIDVDHNECQLFKSYTIQQDDKYQIVWNGQTPHRCGVGFYADGENIFAMDNYQICLEFTKWNMLECQSGVYLKYNGYMKIHCTDVTPAARCNTAGEILDIILEIPHHRFWRVNTTSFILTVYSKDTSYYGVALLSAVAILCIIVMIACILLKRKNSNRSHRRYRRMSSMYSLQDNTDISNTTGPLPPPYSPREENSPPPYTVEDPNKQYSIQHI